MVNQSNIAERKINAEEQYAVFMLHSVGSIVPRAIPWKSIQPQTPVTQTSTDVPLVKHSNKRN